MGTSICYLQRRPPPARVLSMRAHSEAVCGGARGGSARRQKKSRRAPVNGEDKKTQLLLTTQERTLHLWNRLDFE